MSKSVASCFKASDCFLESFFICFTCCSGTCSENFYIKPRQELIIIITANIAGDINWTISALLPYDLRRKPMEAVMPRSVNAGSRYCSKFIIFPISPNALRRPAIIVKNGNTTSPTIKLNTIVIMLIGLRIYSLSFLTKIRVAIHAKKAIIIEGNITSLSGNTKCEKVKEFLNGKC